MRNLLSLLFAFAALPTTSALAQSSFHASLAQPAPAARTVARETLWSCTGQDCRAARSGNHSDVSECRQAARKLGTLTAFWAGERAFTAAEIGRCNEAVETAAK